VAFQRGIDGSEPVRPEGLAAGQEEIRRAVRSRRLGDGTFACPECDAPVAPIGTMRPADAVACPYCDHAARVRDFLSLGDPTRPARVEVRVVHRGARARR
jgi:DNA-directed RNA polymerase subunit RPC12/RpoP